MQVNHVQNHPLPVSRRAFRAQIFSARKESATFVVSPAEAFRMKVKHKQIFSEHELLNCTGSSRLATHFGISRKIALADVDWTGVPD